MLRNRRQRLDLAVPKSDRQTRFFNIEDEFDDMRPFRVDRFHGVLRLDKKKKPDCILEFHHVNISILLINAALLLRSVHR